MRETRAILLRIEKFRDKKKFSVDDRAKSKGSVQNVGTERNCPWLEGKIIKNSYCGKKW